MYFIKNADGAARQRYCEFDPITRDSSDLGGNGSVKEEASDTCHALRKGFQLEAGVYWVDGKEVYVFRFENSFYCLCSWCASGHGANPTLIHAAVAVAASALCIFEGVNFMG